MPIWAEHTVVALVVIACVLILVRKFIGGKKHGGSHCNNCPSKDQHLR